MRVFRKSEALRRGKKDGFGFRQEGRGLKWKGERRKGVGKRRRWRFKPFEMERMGRERVKALWTSEERRSLREDGREVSFGRASEEQRTAFTTLSE